MEDNNKKKKEEKLCCILNTFSSILFLISGIINIVDDGISNWNGITNIALSITFGSLGYMYYKKYKEEK